LRQRFLGAADSCRQLPGRNRGRFFFIFPESEKRSQMIFPDRRKTLLAPFLQRESGQPFARLLAPTWGARLFPFSQSTLPSIPAVLLPRKNANAPCDETRTYAQQGADSILDFHVFFLHDLNKFSHSGPQRPDAFFTTKKSLLQPSESSESIATLRTVLTHSSKHGLRF